jgi:NAD(P)-dependent dehydrogenase (short-subunit alcohol dehydrogenase family)
MTSEPMTGERTTGRLAGKVALITGGARGQGASHGEVLARAGAAVILGDILDEEGERTAARLRDQGHRVHYRRLDVTRAADWAAAVADAEATHGRLDILVNNAGIDGGGNVIDCTPEMWDRVIAVNQTGVFLGMHHAVPAMRRAGGGSIINIASVLGTLGSEFSIAYHASKGAVHLLTRAAAVTLAPEIRVNSVTPGIVDSAMGNALDRQRLTERLAAYPMGRAGKPEEVSMAVLFLASDEASFTTGADLRVDGGAIAGVKRRRPS